MDFLSILYKSLKVPLTKMKLGSEIRNHLAGDAETWTITENEVQVYYDVVNLYPSVPVKEATAVLIE